MLITFNTNLVTFIMNANSIDSRVRDYRGVLSLAGRQFTVGSCTVYPKKYAHGFCFVVLCCGYTLTDFPISIRLTSLALWQSNDCPSASKATLMNMDKYFMWIHYERLHNHNKAKHNKTMCIFFGIYCNDCGYIHSSRIMGCSFKVSFNIKQYKSQHPTTLTVEIPAC